MDTVTGLSCIMQIEITELVNKFYSVLREAQKLDAELKHLVIDLNDLNFVLNKEHDLTSSAKWTCQTTVVCTFSSYECPPSLRM